MNATLYMFSVSPPSLAVREMLRLKGVGHAIVNLPRAHTGRSSASPASGSGRCPRF